MLTVKETSKFSIGDVTFVKKIFVSEITRVTVTGGFHPVMRNAFLCYYGRENMAAIYR